MLQTNLKHGGADVSSELKLLRNILVDKGRQLLKWFYFYNFAPCSNFWKCLKAHTSIWKTQRKKHSITKTTIIELLSDKN